MRNFAGMFVRKRRNKSGATSVVVVDKSSGRFKELTTIGVASTSEEIAELEKFVNDVIAKGIDVTCEEYTVEEAKAVKEKMQKMLEG